MAEPERRRRRPAVSCTLCRRRKVRCNRESPCSNCVRCRNEDCVYESYPSLSPLRHIGAAQKPREFSVAERVPGSARDSTIPSYASGTLVGGDSTATSPFIRSQPSARDVDSMVSRIKQLEHQLSKTAPQLNHSHVSTPNSNIETLPSTLGGTLHLHHENRSLAQPHAITRSISHKTRLFGQSHWINPISRFFQEMVQITEPHLRGEASKALAKLAKCKALARTIKSQRTPPWPCPPSTDLPTKDICDELVDCYLRTTETVYRVLHVPTFRKEYEALWLSDVEPNASFLVQLKLVLAIGATTYDEKFSLRATAIRWVYEAQTWLSEPIFKPRLGLQALQTSVLFLIAQEAADVGCESIWITAGSLIRRAVCIGLHRDPANLPRKPVFATEMRRRLWGTILEISVLSSLSSGGPPLVSLDDFDTEPPSNFDDDQLMAEDPVPKPEGSFTDMSIPIALRKTLPLRLAVTKFLNDLSSRGTYDETLRLDSEMRASYKVLCRTIQTFNSSFGPSPAPFGVRAVDFIMHRYISALHAPFFNLAMRETAYAFSRKVVVESSLKIWCAVYPSSSLVTTQAQTTGNTAAPDRDDFARFATCGSGFYRTVGMQATLLISMELMSQLQDEESIGPVPLRQDLLSVVEDARVWCMQCIGIGETNIKGYLFASMVAAQIDGLRRGVPKDDIPGVIIGAAERAQEVCLPILEDMAAQIQTTQGAEEGCQDMPLDLVPEMAEDWDFMMSYALLDPETTEPMAWMVDGEPGQEQFW